MDSKFSLLTDLFNGFGQKQGSDALKSRDFYILSASNRLLLSCMIGNSLEWYDFVIYGYFAAQLGALFFPGSDPLLQLLASWGVFWTGYLSRPLGSIFFGHIGDKIGRKSMLTLSIYFMAIPTTFMGCLPTYDQVGISATIILIMLRTLQGFAMGGEFTGTMVFLVEHAPNSKRGLWGSFASFSAIIGIIIGSLLVTATNYCFSEDEMGNFGWRIPFLVSIFGSIIGGYMRSKLVEPDIYIATKTKVKNQYSLPLKCLFSEHKLAMLWIMLLDVLTSIGFFIVAIFLATYFRTYLHYSSNVALGINSFNMCIFATFTFLGGWLSDKKGRKPVLGYACLGFILFSYPLFLLLVTGNFYALIAAQAGLALMMGFFYGALPTALAELMPTHIRGSGLSISHNICVSIFGGGTPIMATYLIEYTHNLASPAFLLIAAGFISLIPLLFIRENRGRPLD